MILMLKLILILIQILILTLIKKTNISITTTTTTTEVGREKGNMRGGGHYGNRPLHFLVATVVALM